MEVINKMVDNSIMDMSAWSKVIRDVTKHAEGFVQKMDEGGYSQPSTPELHRKAVAKRKKRKRGGHK